MNLVNANIKFWKKLGDEVFRAGLFHGASTDVKYAPRSEGNGCLQLFETVCRDRKAGLEANSRMKRLCS